LPEWFIRLRQTANLKDRAQWQKHLIGSPEEIASRLVAPERTGIDLVLLQFSPRYEEMERFGEQVAPLVREMSRAVA
jgi:alkanesulfonate monooxygenase SsuD/methylene tetrahydromethanopterin reductase-like flavin-dependent oxidoreductase (luciferase family)